MGLRDISGGGGPRNMGGRVLRTAEGGGASGTPIGGGLRDTSMGGPQRPRDVSSVFFYKEKTAGIFGAQQSQSKGYHTDTCILSRRLGNTRNTIPGTKRC